MSSWNSGRIIGQKPPLKPKEVCAIRTRLQLLGAMRDLALFNLAIDSKLRACDLVAILVGDVDFWEGSRPGDHHPAENQPGPSDMACRATIKRSLGPLQPGLFLHNGETPAVHFPEPQGVLYFSHDDEE